MGKAAEGEAAIARFRARAVDLRHGLNTGAAQTTVSVVRVYAAANACLDDLFRLMLGRR